MRLEAPASFVHGLPIKADTCFPILPELHEVCMLNRVLRRIKGCVKQRFRCAEKFVTLKRMRVHASCVARAGPDGYDAVLLMGPVAPAGLAGLAGLAGPAGAGKSDMSLRLIHAGWSLVADDQVIIAQGVASAPASLAGLLEVRGLGLFRLPFLKSAPLRLVVRLVVPPAVSIERLPEPQRDEVFDLPVIALNASAISAVERVSLALDAACGRVVQLAGAFAM